MIYFIGNSELVQSTLYKQSTIEDCVLWLAELPSVNLDTETEGFFNHKNKILMLQLNYGDITYIIDVRYVDITPLKEHLENKLVIGQNLKFDYKFLKFHGIELNQIYDTFIAECCLTNGLQDRELGLAALAKKYCNITLDKSIRGQFTNIGSNPFTEKQIVYGVGDVTCLSQIKLAQEQEIERLDLKNWVLNEMEACLALADIEYNGMGFDALKWLELAKTASFNESTYTTELDDMVRNDPKLAQFVKKHVQGNLFVDVEDNFTHERDVDIKWSSPAQVDKLFKVLLGVQLDSTSERFLSKYQNKYPLVKRFIDYKKQAKLITTYGQDFLNYINPNTGRIHTSFWQVLETTRVSSGSKKDNTPNMQNIPAKAEYRACFVPKEGFKLVTCDFSGQELRLTAHGSKEPLWVDAFNNGEDLHSKVASMVFNIPLDKVRDKPEFLRGKSYRDVAKIINFGLVYGMSKHKLSDTLSITIEEADKIIKDYFKATKKLNEFLSTMRTYGMANGYIRSFSPYRIIRYFPNWKQNNSEIDFKERGIIERASMNTVIQSSGAQMAKRALVLIRKYIKDNKLQDKVFIVMTVHDQIDVEVESSFAEEWSKIQKNIMEEAGREIIKDIPVLSEIIISNYWSK